VLSVSQKLRFIKLLAMVFCCLSASSVAQFSMTFGDQTVGTTSAPLTFPISNQNTLAFLSLNIQVNSLDYHVGPGTTCPTFGTLGPNSSCSLNIEFAPTAAGLRTGIVTINELGFATITITLGGTGVAALPPAPAPLAGTGEFNVLTNRQAWLQALSGQTPAVIDFEKIAPAGGFAFFDTAAGLTADGVNFVGLAPSNQSLPFYLRVVDPAFGPAFYDWGSGAVLHGPPVPFGPIGEGGPGSHIHVALPKGTTSLGTDIMSFLQYASPFEVTVTTAAGTSKFQVPTQTHPNRAFVGFVSPTDISSVDFSALNGFPVLDNFSYSPPSRGSFAYTTNFASSNISAYSVDPVAGTLTPVPGSPFPAGSGSIAVAVDRSNQFAYVANWFGDNISAYSIDQTTGALIPLSGSPFPAGLQPFALTIDPGDRFLYAANASSNNVSAYTIDSATGALTPVAGSPFPAGVLPNSVTADPSGRFLYVTNRNSNTVSSFVIDNLTGALTQVPGFPFATPVTPQAITVDNRGTFAYVANCSGGVTEYAINSSTGALSALGGSDFPAGFCPWWIALDPSGRFAYVANAGGTVSGFTVDATSGVLSPVPGSPIGAGRFPASVGVDPTGQIALVANNTDGNVEGYRINPANGAITSIGTFPADLQPGSLAFTGPIIQLAGTPSPAPVPNPSPTSFCGAMDISQQTRVIRSGMNYIFPSTYLFSQTIEVMNIGTTPIPAPLYLVLDGLPTNIPSFKGLLGSQLVTHCDSPQGSYLVPINVFGGTLALGGLTSIPLIFTSQDTSGIAYATRVLSGTPIR
jgi:6-phosphogluconolactonase